MRIFVYLPFLACAFGVATAHALARRAEPHLSARVLAATCVVLASATAAALSLIAFSVIARIPFVAEHGHWASSGVGRKMPVPVWLGVLAIACIGAIAVNAIRMLENYRRSLAPAVRLQRESAGQIVTITDPHPFAYACRVWPFRPGVIVISDGMQRSLDDDQRAAVLAHEQSHLAHQHSVYELIALLASGLNPFLRPIQREIGFSLERWADEDAAAAHGRDVAASALATSALQTSRATPSAHLAHATNGVSSRVHALLEAPRPRNRLLLVTAVANSGLATVAVLIAAHNTELIFEALRR